MKTTILALILMLLSISIKAQCNNSKNAVYISGFANKVIYPETHTISFWLEEYFDEDNRGTRQLVSIEQTLNSLKARLKQFGLKEVNLDLISVGSINPNGYGHQGTKDNLRNVFVIAGVKEDKEILLNIINNLRLKGLNGINIKQEYSMNDEFEKQLCEMAIKDALENADNIFKQLGMKRGSILNVSVNNRSNADISSWENNYQNVYGQYTFSMIPKNIACSVTMTFEILQSVNKE